MTVSGALTLTAAPILSALSASLPVVTNASKQLASATVTGTGTTVVLNAAPTFTGTSTFAEIRFSQSVWSSGAFATPAAFTSTLCSYFASTVSGAAIMGYGTTGDVTLKNRAGTSAAWVVSNTKDFYIDGNLTGGVISPFSLMGA
jgi:hypothetical protein